MGWNEERELQELEKTHKETLSNTEQEKFEFEEAKSTAKKIYLIYGKKGEGKTTTAMGFPGDIAVICFDNKSLIIKENMYNNDDRIRVYNAIRFFDESFNNILSSSVITYRYTMFLLENLEKTKQDWILIDGLEVFSRIAEFVMRSNHNLKPFQGIPNINIWKERRLILKELHNKALKAAKKGVIYTTYTRIEEIIDEGTIITKREVPEWFDVVMWETDVVIHVYTKRQKDRLRFLAEIVSSKLKNLPTGRIFDITNKTLEV